MHVANATEAPLMLKLSKILVSELSDILGISIITLSGKQHSQGKKQKKIFLMKQFIYLMFSLLLCSCGTMRHTQMQIAERIRKDTIYLSNVRYDSVYIYKDKLTDRSRDTLYIKEWSIEYRYKLLRDTIKVVQIDSIPYEVRIVETIEVEHPPTLYDRICKATFWLLICIVAIFTYLKLKRI